jgi:dihydroflavonol-4-reductase
VEGDVTAPASLLKAVEGVDVVFHLAGIRRSAVREDFMRVNAEGTRYVAEAMGKAGARRLVLAGSLAASGSSVGGRPREEADPFCPEEWYGESKAEAERIAFSFSRQLEVTCIRPSRIVGPRDHENLPFFKLVKRGVVLRIGGPERRISMVDVDDVVQQLLLQADKEEAVGEAFFCSSGESFTVEELMRHIATALGAPARTVVVPELALKGLGAAADVVSRATGRKLPLNQKLARQLLAPGWSCSIEKAKRVLGFRPAHALTDSVQRTLEGYRAAGWL